MPVTELKADGKETKRRFDQRDWDYIAEYVIEEYNRRKQERKDRERCWDEIDRQIAMEPEISYKKLPNGRIDTKKRWMAETELPLQAQALEVLTADARRMLFPTNGPWFRAHAEVTDEYLRQVDFQALVLGDENEVPSRITQDNADKLAQGFLLHLYRQPFNDEDFFTRVDRINAEAIKYGMGVGRARMYARSFYTKKANGVAKKTRRIPVLAPVSIRNLYLDDPKPSMHSSQLLEPAHIARDYIRLENLQMAANRGSTDPDDEDGGWMPKNVAELEADDDGYVTLLEMEGDIVVPRKTVRSMVIPSAIVTVAIGGKDASGALSTNVIRFRYRETPFPSYLLFPYHYECVDTPYPTSPLMKGRPVQMAATDALNRFLDSAMLKIAPPVGYDRTDMIFAQEGGPMVYPYAQWGTTDQVNVHTELGGDPSVMVGAMSQFINLYAELTGVLPARLGAQTVSHTTAYAKNAELERGATRTVDYVNQIGQGSLTRWLHMSYYMALSEMSPQESVRFWIDAYGGFVEVTRNQLPPRAGFEWFGSGGPGEEQARRQQKLQALGLALQMDSLGMQTGRPPTVDIPAAIREALREGGWTDVDAITNAQQQAQPMASPQQQDLGMAMAALQQLPGVIGGQ
jgi:hypothetical protein